MALEISKWDVTEYLDSEEAIVAYIEAAFEDGDPELIKRALGDVARARGMTSIARDAGVTREALYKPLSEKGDPKLASGRAARRAGRIGRIGGHIFPDCGNRCHHRRQC